MDKKTIWAIVGAIIVVIFIVFVFFKPSSQTPPPLSTTSTESSAVAPAGTTPKTSQPTLTRDAAYKIYSAKKLYVQLVDCIGFPGYLSMTRGTKFMIENLSSLPAVFTMQGQTVSLVSKGFKIVTATESGFYGAMCNGKNALKLQVSPN